MPSVSSSDSPLRASSASSRRRWAASGFTAARSVVVGDEAEEHVLEPLAAGAEVGQREVVLGQPGGEGGDERGRAGGARRGTRRRRRPRTGAPRCAASAVDVEPGGAPKRTSSTGPGGERRGGAGRQHPPVVEDHDVVGQALDLVEVVAREQHGDAVVAQPGDDLADLLATHRVDPGAGLVEERDLRAADQREGEGEPSLLAAGDLPPGAPLEAREPDPLEQLARVERVRRTARRRGAAPRARARPGRRRRTAASRPCGG